MRLGSRLATASSARFVLDNASRRQTSTPSASRTLQHAGHFRSPNGLQVHSARTSPGERGAAAGGQRSSRSLSSTTMRLREDDARVAIRRPRSEQQPGITSPSKTKTKDHRLFVANTKYVYTPKSLRSMFEEYQRDLRGCPETHMFLKACAQAAIRLRSHKEARFYITELDEWEKSHPGCEDPERRRWFLYTTLTWASAFDADFCQELFRKIPESTLRTKDCHKMIAFLRNEPQIAAGYIRLMIIHNLPPDSRVVTTSLKIAAVLKDFELGQSIWDWASSRPEVKNEWVNNARVNFLNQLGRQDLRTEEVRQGILKSGNGRKHVVQNSSRQGAPLINRSGRIGSVSEDARKYEWANHARANFPNQVGRKDSISEEVRQGTLKYGGGRNDILPQSFRQGPPLRNRSEPIESFSEDARHSTSKYRGRKPKTSRVLAANTKFVLSTKNLKLMYEEHQRDFMGCPNTHQFLRACASAAIRLRSPDDARFYLHELDEWEGKHPGCEDPHHRRAFLHAAFKMVSTKCADDVEFCRELFGKVPENYLRTGDICHMVRLLEHNATSAADYIRLMMFYDLPPDPQAASISLRIASKLRDIDLGQSVWQWASSRPGGKDHMTYVDWIRLLSAVERRDLIEEAKAEAAANGIELHERDFNF